MSQPELRAIEHDSAEYWESVALRLKILRIPLGLSFRAELLAEEKDDIHLAAWVEGRMAACLVLTPKSADRMKMRQVAVDFPHQGQGIGSKLVSFSERFARDRGFSEMVLSARQEAVSFYERLGYIASGEEFFEVGIPHRFMTKQIAASGRSGI